jgi:hypothetical protein
LFGTSLSCQLYTCNLRNIISEHYSMLFIIFQLHNIFYMCTCAGCLDFLEQILIKWIANVRGRHMPTGPHPTSRPQFMYSFSNRYLSHLPFRSLFTVIILFYWRLNPQLYNVLWCLPKRLSIISLVSLFLKSKKQVYEITILSVSVYPPPPLTFEWLSQSLWNFVCISRRLSPSQRPN